MGEGPALFGYCIDIFLYGILTVQTYLYYLVFPKDKWQVKSVVYFVYIIGTIQTALALRDFYTLFCTEPDSLESLEFGSPRFGFMWFTIPVSSALVAVVAQLFYAHRIYTISRGKVITIIVSTLAILQFLCGITSAIIIYNPQGPPVFNISGFVAGQLVNGAAWGSFGAICDIVIAVYMCRSLSKQLAQASRTTQVLLTRIKRLVVETGVVTAAMAAMYIFASLFFLGDSTSFMIPGLSLGKLYSNSVLVILNNRFTILGGRNAPRPDPDVALYRRHSVSETRDRAAVSDPACVHSHPTETLVIGDARTVELLAPSLGRASVESSEVSKREKHAQEV